MNRFISFIVLMLLFSSCVDFHKDEWVNDIQKMEKSVAEMQIKINDSNKVKLKILLKTIQQKENQIVKLYQEDTLSIHFAETMSQFRNTREKVTPLLDLKNYLDSTLKHEKTQLIKLKKDIQNGVGKRNLYQKYVEIEKKNVLKLEMLYDTLSLKSETIKKRYVRLLPAVDKIINNMKTP